MKDAKEWIKYLNDFAFERDGTYGNCEISAEDVYAKMLPAAATTATDAVPSLYQQTISKLIF